MTTYLCATCAVETDGPRTSKQICPICADERQYLPPGGQRWTSVDELIDAGHRVACYEVEDGLLGLRAEPTVGIGQQALLVRGREGSVLWDPPGLITDEAVDQVRSAGKVLAVAASHPHMFGVQLDWAAALDAPVLVSEADAGWLQRSSDTVRTWNGTYPLTGDLTLLKLGGHFPGSSVLLWTGGAGGKGVLLTGDTISSNPDGTASFMRSYPNRIPLSGAVVQRIADATDGLEFDRIYNNFGGMIAADARTVVRFSADRHAAWVRGDYDHLT